MVVAERGYTSYSLARIIVIDVITTLAPVALAILLNSAYVLDKYVNADDAFRRRVISRSQLLAVGQVLLAMLVRLPFWRRMLWSRLLTLGLLFVFWFRTASSTAIMVDYMFGPTTVVLLTLVLAHSQENTQRQVFEQQHTDSSPIIDQGEEEARGSMFEAVTTMLERRFSGLVRVL